MEIYSRRGRNYPQMIFVMALIIMYCHDSNLQQSFLQCDNNTVF